MDKLLKNIDGYLKAGFNGVKIKIGRENPDEDVERIKAVREFIGPDITFMVDANYSMTVEQAIDMANRIKQYDITWFEEPTIPDNYKATLKSLMQQACLLPWVRIFTPYTSLNMLWNSPN